jgi:hypothetical protein
MNAYQMLSADGIPPWNGPSVATANGEGDHLKAAIADALGDIAVSVRWCALLTDTADGTENLRAVLSSVKLLRDAMVCIEERLEQMNGLDAPE